MKKISDTDEQINSNETGGEKCSVQIVENSMRTIQDFAPIAERRMYLWRREDPSGRQKKSERERSARETGYRVEWVEVGKNG